MSTNQSPKTTGQSFGRVLDGRSSKSLDDRKRETANMPWGRKFVDVTERKETVNISLCHPGWMISSP